MKIAMIGLRGIGYPAGIDNYVTEIARRMAKAGHAVTVYCQRPYFERESEIDGVRAVSIWTIKGKYFATPLYALFASFHAAFGRHDVVHYHGLGSALFCVLPYILGKKTIVTVHALDWEGKKWGWFAKKILRLAASAAVRFPNATTVVSKNAQDYFAKHYRRVPIYIPNGVSVVSLRNPELIKKYGLDKENYVLFLGRLTPGKGCEYLIEAFDEIHSKIKLVIAGDAIQEHDYVRRLKILGREKIIFTGWVDGKLKEELLSNAYLFVQPSELEGMSGALLEAMSFGRCVVASDIPENLEVVGESGFFSKKMMSILLKK